MERSLADRCSSLEFAEDFQRFSFELFCEHERITHVYPALCDGCVVIVVLVDERCGESDALDRSLPDRVTLNGNTYRTLVVEGFMAS